MRQSQDINAGKCTQNLMRNRIDISNVVVLSQFKSKIFRLKEQFRSLLIADGSVTLVRRYIKLAKTLSEQTSWCMFE